MSTIKLPVVLTPGEDGQIIAQAPIIPGCISQGMTRQDALENIREAALLCLECMDEEGWSLPKEFSVEQAPPL